VHGVTVLDTEQNNAEVKLDAETVARRMKGSALKNAKRRHAIATVAPKITLIIINVGRGLSVI